MSLDEKEAVLAAYFEEGLESEEIAKQLDLPLAYVTRVLGDRALLEPYKKRSEAAKLRAQIYVNESAEEAARRQAALLRSEQTKEAVFQRAAKDILDRAGVRVGKEEKGEIVIRFEHGDILLGSPRGQEETC